MLQLRMPFKKGRLVWVPEKHAATLTADQMFATSLTAVHLRNGKVIDVRHLGSGLVTNVGVQAMANDFAWAAPSGASVATLKLANQHASGTGTTAAAATDIQLQTSAGPSPAAGAQTFVTAANLQKYQTVATLNYVSTLAITEWGLFTSATLSATTGTPFTAGTATTGTVTATPYTASSATVQGQQQLIIKDTTAASPFYGLIVSNTTGVVTVPAWYKVSDGTLSGVNPVNADAFTLQPVMLDHKIFAAINVVSGDAIQFTYQLTVASGG